MMTVPQHVAVIMDGNGRWAQRSYLPRVYGHRIGLETAKQLIDHAICRGIGQLTLFALSTENMRRPPSEVNFLLTLFAKMLRDDMAGLLEKDVRLQIIGNRLALPTYLQDIIEEVEEKSRNNRGMILSIAVNYSGRWHLAEVAKSLIDEVLTNGGQVGDINEEMIHTRIQQTLVSDPDLLIRTGNEQRLSNFMLWSLAYSELYFSEKYWPDFSVQDFDAALTSYGARNRRYGGIEEETYE